MEQFPEVDAFERWREEEVECGSRSPMENHIKYLGLCCRELQHGYLSHSSYDADARW